jgi:hypothetical protein
VARGKTAVRLPLRVEEKPTGFTLVDADGAAFGRDDLETIAALINAHFEIHERAYLRYWLPAVIVFAVIILMVLLFGRN